MRERPVFRQQLTAFYSHYAPSEMEKVDVALNIDKPEDEVWGRLYSKYNVNVQEADRITGRSINDAAAAGGGVDRDTFKRQLTAFYERYAPTEMDKVDAAFGLDRPQDVIWAKLYRKYNVDEAEAERLTGRTGPPREDDASLKKGGGATPPPAAVAPSAAPTATSPTASAFDEELLTRQLDAFYDTYRGGKRQTTKALDNVRAGTAITDLWAHLFKKSGVSEADGKSFLASIVSSQPIGRDDAEQRQQAAAEEAAEEAAAKAKVDEVQRLSRLLRELEEREVSARMELADVEDGQRAKLESLRRAERPATPVTPTPSAPASPVRSTPPPAPQPAPAPAPAPTVASSVPAKRRVPVAEKTTASSAARETATKVVRRQAPTTLGPRGSGSRNATPKRAAPAGSSDLTGAAADRHHQDAGGSFAPWAAAGGFRDDATAVSFLPTDDATHPAPRSNASTTRRRSSVSVAATSAAAAAHAQSTPHRRPSLMVHPHQAGVKPHASEAEADDLIREAERKVDEANATLAAAATRERIAAEREAALAIREAAFEAQRRMAAIRGGGTASPSSVPQQGGSGDAAVSAATARHAEEYHRQLVQLECTLREMLLSTQRQAAALESREEAIAAAETRIAALVADAEGRNNAVREHEATVSRELARERGRTEEALRSTQAELKRAAEHEKTLLAKGVELRAKETELGAIAKELVAKEKRLNGRAEALKTERELARKLSDDLLRREGALRTAEKGMNAARAQLKSLEDDVATRVKRVVSDQEALKRWELELTQRAANAASSP